MSKQGRNGVGYAIGRIIGWALFALLAAPILLAGIIRGFRRGLG